MRKQKLKSSLCNLILLLGILCSFQAQAKLKADFTVSATSGCIPLSVNFTNLTTGGTGTISYQWKFGNGNRSSLTTPSAIYTSAGNFTVVLIAKDASGNIDSIVKTALISVFDKPQPDFKSDIQTGCPPLTVNFTDLSKKGSGNISSWLWDFGDGTTSTLQNPSHTYSKSGNFRVLLVVTDKNGCSNTADKKNFITPNAAPNADFSAPDTTSCSAPFSVTFAAVTTGSGYTYTWDFGDGTTGSGNSPTHQYTTSGSFAVTLTVTDGSGCSGTMKKRQYIIIGKEVPIIYAPIHKGCLPLNVSFSGSTAPGYFSCTYTWDFGDGTTSNSSSPKHTYTKEGTYTVTLVAKTPAGCTDQAVATDYVVVSKPPVASFKAVDSIVCNPDQTAVFLNTSSGGAKYAWTFGDGITSKEESPIHFYKDTGVYTVSLTVTDANGCKTSITRSNYITISPVRAIMHASRHQGCAPVTGHFLGEKRGIVPIDKWHWDFGDGTTSNSQNPGDHLYADTGIYLVTLVVTTVTGCVDYAYDTAKAGTKPTASFTMSRTSGCLNQLRHVKFFNTTNRYSRIKADHYLWDFGDSFVSHESSPEHRYELKPGKYVIKLVAYNKACTDTAEMDTFTVTAPFAKFGYTRGRCPDNIVAFSDSSIGDDFIMYHFGDGDSSNQKNPVHNYDPGVYMPWAVVYSKKTGCTDTFMVKAEDTINVHPVFDEKLTMYNSKTGCAPLTVSVGAYVDDSARLQINWGDGAIDTINRIQNYTTFLNHTYTRKGLYKIVMNGTSYKGCALKKEIDSILVSGPQALMDVTPETGCIPLKLRLEDKSPPDSLIEAKYWIINGVGTFSDTTPVTYYTITDSPIDSTQGVAVTLMVRTKGGCTDTITKIVYPKGPSIHYAITVISDCKNLTYTMNPSVRGRSPYKWHWDFGDGTSSTEVGPVKQYTTDGVYKITLSVSDASGCTDTTSQFIDTRLKGPVARFNAFNTAPSCPPLLVKVRDSSISGFFKIRKYDYDFGDGTHSDKPDAEHVYVTPGTYDVTLTITDNNGCVSTMIRKGLVVIHGATGEMSISSNAGCDPLTVQFKGTSASATHFTWDFGDGDTSSHRSPSHVYKYDPNIQFYIPALILRDSFGCEYTLPRKDTIRVFPYPKADFTHGKACFGYPTYFYDASSYTGGPGSGSKWFWDFGDGDTSTLQNPGHIYKKNGYYKIVFVSYNSRGCADTIIRVTKIGGVGANLVTTHPTGCVAHPVYFLDKTISDTTILSWLWLFGDGDSSREQNPTHTYLKKGLYDIKLVVNDVVGCSDTFVKRHFVVGDTVAPRQRHIYRVTVLDDHTTEMDFQADRNFDFYKYIIYRQQPDGSFLVIDSVFDQKDTIYEDKFLNTLRYTYTYKVQVQNACGYQSFISLPHTTMNLSAAPGINKAFLSWTPYIGWNKISKYNIYRQDVVRPSDWHFVDSVAGDVTSYTDSAIICYQTMHYKIKAIEEGGYQMESWSDTAAAKPVYIPHVPGTELVLATVENSKYTHIEWQDLPKTKVQFWILEKSADDRNFSAIDTPYYRNTLAVNDYHTDVDRHSYTYRVKVVDSCGDMGPYSNIGKTILLHVDTTEDIRPILTWNRYKLWPEGVRQYDIQIRDNNGNFNTIDRARSIKDTVYIDNITDLNSLGEYCYRIVAHRNISKSDSTGADVTSISNTACTPSHLFVWVPNVFTPNGDGLNDLFLVKGLYIKEFHITIFDRWGTRVFESNSITNGWNGRFHGGKPLMDVYKYMISVKGVNDDEKFINGNITLLP